VKIKISRNVFAPAAQVIVSGVVLFVLYRYLYDNLGVAQIGVWSLVLAATSVSRIGDLGLSAGVVKFVAQALGANDGQKAADVIQTVILTLGVAMGILLIIGYPLFSMILNYLLPATSVQIGLNILPYALMSLWMMMIVAALSGALDGCMRLDLRSVITAVSHFIFLGMVLILVPMYGLEGVAIAQVVQSAVLLALLWWALRHQLKQLPIIPLHWKYSILKNMFGYGVKFQIITVMNMLFDPVVKALLSKFGGLESLGLYEMANGLVLKARAIIIEANRVMVPVIAKLATGETGKAEQMFTSAYSLNFYGAIALYGLLGIFASTICVLWLGHYQSTFVYFVLLLNLGWFANTLNGPAYFANLGAGKLEQNMIAHIIMGFFSFILGGLLGALYGGFGVVSGTVLGLIAGSLYLLIEYIKRMGSQWHAILLPQGMANGLLMAGALIALANGIAGQTTDFVWALSSAFICAFIYMVVLYRHPNRRVLLKQNSGE
jgi:O-antigen/teichoic acid export membrane protein